MPDKIGQRNTPQREMIYDIISSAKGPMTIENICQEANKENQISISTVYRTVNLLLKNDRILKTIIASGQPRYEQVNKNKHHHHFLCRICNGATCIDVCPISPSKINQLNSNFIVESHELVIHGICKPCAAS